MNVPPVTKNRGLSKNNGEPSGSGFGPIWLVIVLVATLLGVLGALWVGATKVKVQAQNSSPAVREAAGSMSTRVSPVFTTARRSFLDALKEYFNLQPTPVQPIAFNHKIHIQNGLECENCHEGVTQGPDAGIASVSTCTTCHQSNDSDNPEIKKLMAYADKDQEVPWQPVFWFYPAAHVLFRHAPHTRNGIACAECHGDISNGTVAVRTKNLSMNFCLSCHKAKGVDLDCITCHN
jgi:formylmethanofuran dehydrogenase subunit E